MSPSFHYVDDGHIYYFYYSCCSHPAALAVGAAAADDASATLHPKALQTLNPKPQS